MSYVVFKDDNYEPKTCWISSNLTNKKVTLEPVTEYIEPLGLCGIIKGNRYVYPTGVPLMKNVSRDVVENASEEEILKYYKKLIYLVPASISSKEGHYYIPFLWWGLIIIAVLILSTIL